MKTLFVAALFLGLATVSYADIQDPPSNDYGPTRKLGRGISNFLFAPAEVPVTIAKINRDEGNAAAAGYGVVLGVGRSFVRGGAGLFEILTWPIPVVHGTLLCCRGPRTECMVRIRNFRLSSATNQNIPTSGIIRLSSRTNVRDLMQSLGVR